MEFWEKFKQAFNFEATGVITVIFMIALKNISKYMKDNIPFWIDYVIKKTSRTIAKIHVILRKALYKLNCDRSSLILFNSKVSLNLDSLVIDSIHEVLEDGVSSAISYRRKINVFSLGNLIKDLLDNEFLVYTDVTSLDPVLSAFFMNQNTQEAYLKLVVNAKNDPVGILLLESCKTNLISDSFINNELRLTANRLVFLI